MMRTTRLWLNCIYIYIYLQIKSLTDERTRCLYSSVLRLLLVVGFRPPPSSCLLIFHVRVLSIGTAYFADRRCLQFSTLCFVFVLQQIYGDIKCSFGLIGVNASSTFDSALVRPTLIKYDIITARDKTSTSFSQRWCSARLYCEWSATARRLIILASNE